MSTEAADTAPVTTTTRSRQLWVTLSNPPDNRITPEIVTGLNDAMNRLETEDLDLMVITGRGRAFSKGMDAAIMESHRDPVALRPVLVLSNAVISRIAHSPKLTVAAINGACMGAGLEVALACHLRICSDKARLGLPEIWINQVPGFGGFYRLAKLVGTSKTLELTALGDLIDAEAARQLNVVSRVFPGDRFAEHAESFVDALAVADQRAIQHLITLAASADTLGAEDNIRAGCVSFVDMASRPCKPA